jgi:hypothetical protein
MKDRQYNVLRLEDTKGVTRICKSMKDRQYNSLRLEDTKGVTRTCKFMKDRQYNGLRIEDTKGVTRTLWYLQLLTLVLSVLHWITHSSYPFGIFKP